jgi:hypothetical protein
LPLRDTVPCWGAPLESVTVKELLATSSLKLALRRVTAPAVLPSAGDVDSTAGALATRDTDVVVRRGEYAAEAAAVPATAVSGAHSVTAANAANEVTADTSARRRVVIQFLPKTAPPRLGGHTRR